MTIDPDHLHEHDPLLELLHQRMAKPILAYLGMRIVDGCVVDAHTDPRFERPPKNEQEAVQLLIALRWPKGWRCDRCDHARFTLSPSRPRQARCANCARRRSVTSGTALQRKHDLCRWFAAAMIIGAARQASAHAFAIAWGCAYRTALLTLHTFRALPREARALLDGATAKDDLALLITRCRPDAYDLKRTRPRNHNVPPERPLTMRRQVFATQRGVLVVDRVPNRVRGIVGGLGRGGEASIHAKHLRAIIHRVHRTVSPRWHHRYTTAITWRTGLARLGFCPRLACMRAILGSPCQPYSALPPP